MDVDVGSLVAQSVVVPLVITAVTLIIVGVVVRRVLSGAGMTKKSRQQMAERAQQLQATGAKARARVLSIQPTGMIINELNIQVDMSFQLEPLDGQPSFPASKQMTINQVMMPRVGDVLPSWYDRQDPTTFAVAIPGAITPEQIPLYREFGIPHPLDQQPPA